MRFEFLSDCDAVHASFTNYVLEEKADVDRWEREVSQKLAGFGRKVDLLKNIPSQDKVMFDELHSIAKDALGSCAFNWISPAFWGEWFEAKQ